MQGSDIQTIVQHLNEKPFDLGLRLIDFGEKTPLELLEILMDVLNSIDNFLLSEDLCARFLHDNPQIVQSNLVPFLSSLQYPLLPQTEDEMKTFVASLAAGEIQHIYSILLYCLDNHLILCEKIHMSRFLEPVQIPLDITMTQRDTVLSDLAEDYQSLQEEFQTLFHRHKNAKKEEDDWYETCVNEDLNTLQNEKTVLLERVGGMEDRISQYSDSFRQLVTAGSMMRKEEDSQSRLSEKMEQQQKNLKPNEIKLNDLKTALESIRASYGSEDTVNISDVLNGLQEEVVDLTMIVKSELVSRKSILEGSIKKAERMRDRPPCTVDELNGIITLRRSLEAEMNVKKALLKEKQATKSHPNIEMFKQHANVSEKKVKVKEQALEENRVDFEALREKVARLEARWSALSEEHIAKEIEMPDGRVLHGLEIASYLKECDEILKDQEGKKVDVATMKEEIADLDRIMANVKERHENLDKLIEKNERMAGVDGYHAAQERLQRVEQDSGDVNNEKGQALKEISELISQMNEILKKDRKNLQPKIHELKETRAEFKSMQKIHAHKKSRHDKFASQLASARQFLEQECKLLQSNWVQGERDYHYLSNALEIVEANLEKARIEGEWRENRGEMSGDFRSLHDLYEHKLNQKETAAKQLRLEQRDIKENMSKNLKQKHNFIKLHKLLQLKLRLKQENKDSETSPSMH